MDSQFLPCVQLDLPGLPGERIGSVHPDDPADPVQGLTLGKGLPVVRLRKDIGGIAPGSLVHHITARPCHSRIRTGEGRPVICLHGTACPHRERRGIHDQDSVHGLDIRKMACDVLAGTVIDRIAADRVGPPSRISLTATGCHLYAEPLRKAVDQHIAAAREGLSVIELAGALRHKRDSSCISPVAVSSISMILRLCFGYCIRHAAGFFHPFL